MVSFSPTRAFHGHASYQRVGSCYLSNFFLATLDITDPCQCIDYLWFETREKWKFANGPCN